MYITKEQSLDLVKESFENIKDDYLEKLTFLSNLIEGDDWSFVIKSHALIESLITELILLKISDNRLKKVISRISLHGETVSKIAILKIYNLLSADEIKLIIRLSEIRNSIVHNYENLSFTFEKYAESLNSDQIKQWHKLLQLDEIEVNKMNKFITAKPIFAVWCKILSLINSILYETHQLKVNKKLDEQARKTSEELLSLLMNKA